jgi:recombination protein RecT
LTVGKDRQFFNNPFFRKKIMSTELQTKQASGLKEYLTNNLPVIQSAAIQGVSPERLIKTALLLTTSRDGAAIAKCTPRSILRAITDCARFGIEPSFGRAYLVPYANECELQIGYLGLIELVKRSGNIKSITAEIVREGDEFDVEIGSNPVFKHKPKFGNGNDWKYVYALAVFTDNHFEYSVLSRQDVEDIRRKSSKAPDSPAWKNYYGEMAKKCAIRRLCKMLPLTIEAQEAIEADDKRNTVFDVESHVSKMYPDVKQLSAEEQKAQHAMRDNDILDATLNAPETVDAKENVPFET